ncbi:MAG TPA: protein kinase [Pyrinomonadaceae bacterium]|nr:protein kinase [Pyrinomonadaceae bacterium]
MSVSWVKVEEIFLSSLEREPEARPAHLDAVCGGDPRLREEVESLLAWHERAGNFIEAPAVAFAPGLFSDATGACGPSFTGRHVGQYRIERELGRGGMGAVFLARRADDEYQKQVAVKLIRGGLGDRLLLHRFLDERQILADLDHPNVARLIDGGATEDGTPYLVMDYIEGVPVDEYCDRERLSISARLRLFRDICAAVDYAHRNLVVHRDLKPSNILVTADGAPKLLDFGIAKLLGRDARAGAETATAACMMTPEYASPEQVRGASITTASDIYSLGVLLYKLLTGHQPYRFKTLLPAEIEKVICETEPEKPSVVVTRPQEQAGEDGATTSRITAETVSLARGEKPRELRRRLKGDLDAIVLTAMRKEPERRYTSAAQFSEDIRRHLEGRPVLAHQDSLGYRAAKFVRRNRAAVTAAALVVVALVAGLALALWQAGVARRERDRAERRFDDVRRLSNALLTDIAPKIERLEGSTVARQALVAQSLKYLDSLAGESADDFVLQAELAAAYEQVGVLQGDSRKPSLSDFRGAIVSLEKAQAIRRRLLGTNPGDAENRRLLADNLLLLGVRRMAQNDTEGGIRDEREAMQIYENLVAENPGSLALRTALLETRVEAAISYGGINRFGEAIPLLEQTESELKALHREGADDAEVQRTLANCLAYLGFVLSWESRQPEAEAKMNEAVSLAESLAARHPHDANFKQELWRTYQTAAVIYEEIDNARMFELGDKARKIAEETAATDRANAQARHNLARTYVRLGTAASLLGRPDEAIAYLEKAAAIYLELMDKDPLNRGYDADAAALYTKLGDARWQRRDYPDALAAYQKSVALFEKKVGEDAADMRALRNLATTRATTGSLHADLVKITAGQTRQTHLAAAKENYHRALELMLKAQAQNTLSAWDLRNIDEMRAASEKLERMR